jgi:phosphohistidine swiveling domain-containing protein
MVKAIIELGNEEDKILNIVKGKYGLKNKSDAMKLIIGKFEQVLLGEEFKPESEPSTINDHDEWMLAEDIPDIDLSFPQIWLSGFTEEFAEHSGRSFTKVMTVFKGYHLWFYFGENDSYKVAENLVNKFLDNPQFSVEVNNQIIVESDKLRSFALKIPETNLDQLSNGQLADIYQEHDKIHTEYYRWCWIPVAIDMFHNNLTETLKKYLKDKNVPEDKTSEYLTVLTHPKNKSLIQLEQEEFLHIAEQIQNSKELTKVFKDLYRIFLEEEAAPHGLATHTPEYENLLEEKAAKLRDKIPQERYNQIQEHYQKYFYVKHMWLGKEGVYSFDYYLKELVKFIGRNSNAKKSIAELKEEEDKIAERKKQIEQEVNLDKKWKTLFDSFGEFMVTKIYRRYAQIYAIYRMHPIIKEISRRLEISVMQARFMLTKEVKEALVNNRINRSELQKRTQFCVHYVEKDLEKVYTGIEAERLAKQIKKKEIEEVSEFKGQTGCVGKAKGIVKIIIRPADIAKMNKGDILVSIATDPDIVPAMKKAAAFITEQGGVTSHAAIVAREMKKPCVIGTKIATKVLKDGDLVEVDATRGIVKILNK